MNRYHDTLPDPAIYPIKVSVLRGHANNHEYQFNSPFRIGRASDCKVRFAPDEAGVSRYHGELLFDENSWWIIDLKSTNGIYICGKRVQRAEIKGNIEIQLGKKGPRLMLSPELPPHQQVSREHTETSKTNLWKRYFGKAVPENMSPDTIEIRILIDKDRAMKRKWFIRISSILGLIIIAAGAFILYQYWQLTQLHQRAERTFYEMKKLEVALAQIENKLPSENFTSLRNLMDNVGTEYDQYVENLGIYSKQMSEEDKLILRVARIWGECELNVPDGFVSQVKYYIDKWRSNSLWEEAVRRAIQNNYHYRIARKMIEYHLPPHYFYLALQESAFKSQAAGQQTPYGIAKGIWQFIPSTADDYGLILGPLKDSRLYDPEDDRFDFEKATDAAARYIKDIYATQAQASGLLVIASYNWGEHRVLPLIEKLPENPRERNFWQLLTKHAIPEQTYDYVFRIIAAAVIGEEPALFGFNSESPLKLALQEIEKEISLPE